MKATLKFLLPYGGTWVLTREFTNKAHMDNYVRLMHRTKGYRIDEIWTS